MSNLVDIHGISTMTPEDMGLAERMVDAIGEFPQITIGTDHVIHAGLYARTVTVARGLMVGGTVIKIPTLLIVNGDITLWVGEGHEKRYVGYHVLPASAFRRSVFIANADTSLTMIFATQADSIYAAEDEFAEEPEKLMSRAPGAINRITITGE